MNTFPTTKHSYWNYPYGNYRIVYRLKDDIVHTEILHRQSYAMSLFFNNVKI